MHKIIAILSISFLSMMAVTMPIAGSPIFENEDLYDSLFVNRGSPGENMTTDALHLIVGNHVAYSIEKYGLKEAESDFSAFDLEYEASHPRKIEVPSYLEVDAIWDESYFESGSENNILGDNGLLTIFSESIDVPVVEATRDTLAYYGALLLEKGDIIWFEDEMFPIFEMTVGTCYVNNFLMTDQGGGFYLEYHHDKPHFHMPIHGGGQYILARWNEDKTKLRITAFKIPDGKAVYTKKGAIHSDAALTGDLIVGYDQAHDNSTVLLRTSDLKKVIINFY